MMLEIQEWKSGFQILTKNLHPSTLYPWEEKERKPSLLLPMSLTSVPQEEVMPV